MGLKEKSKEYIPVAQILFYLVIAITTSWSLYITRRQSDLIFKPAVGIVDAKTTRHIIPDSVDVYKNVTGATIAFTIENAGTLPAKDVKIKVRGKIGNTTLPYTETETGLTEEGIVLLPKAKVFNRPKIGKRTIERMVAKERLIYTIQLSFTDWEDYKPYSYSVRYEVSVTKKSPLLLRVILLPPLKL